MSTISLFSPELSDEYKKFLKDVTPSYEESLESMFQTKAESTQRLEQHRNGTLHKLNDVFAPFDNHIIILKNLKLHGTPDFRQTKLSAKLSTLTMNIEMNLGNLKIEGEVENRDAHQLQTIKSGTISINLYNVTAFGRVGLSIIEDSFVASKNYDIDYTPQYVTQEISYANEQSGPTESVRKENLEGTLLTTFWPQLTDTITKLFHLQLGAVIVESSVTETLADKDEELRKHCKQQTKRVNKYIDSLVSSAKSQIHEDDESAIVIPPLSVAFTGPSSNQQAGTLKTENGFVKDFSSIKRTLDMSFYEDVQTVIYGHISLSDLKVGYDKYAAEYMKSGVSGESHIIIEECKLFIKVSFSKMHRECIGKLEKVQITSIGNIVHHISGLGTLPWLAEQIELWTLGTFRNNGLPKLEKSIANALETAIHTVKCKQFLSE